MNLLRTASLSRPLVICQSQLGSFYKYSAFSVLSILTIVLDKSQTKGGGRVVSASGSETSGSRSTPTSAITYDAYTSVTKKKKRKKKASKEMNTLLKENVINRSSFTGSKKKWFGLTPQTVVVAIIHEASKKKLF